MNLKKKNIHSTNPKSISKVYECLETIKVYSTKGKYFLLVNDKNNYETVSLF